MVKVGSSILIFPALNLILSESCIFDICNKLWVTCTLNCCFSVNQHLAETLWISSNIMEIMDIFRLCQAAITFTQYKVNILCK